jgi:hypothetical protein
MNKYKCFVAKEMGKEVEGFLKDLGMKSNTFPTNGSYDLVGVIVGCMGHCNYMFWFDFEESGADEFGRLAFYKTVSFPQLKKLLKKELSCASTTMDSTK